MSALDAMFGKPADPKEQVKKWKQQMRHEQRMVDRQIRSEPQAVQGLRCQPVRRDATRGARSVPSAPAAGIQREEQKVKASIKQAVKRGDMSNAKTLCKEVVRSKKATNRMHVSKAHMNSVVMQMENQLGAPGSVATFSDLSARPSARSPSSCGHLLSPRPLSSCRRALPQRKSR